MTGSSDDPMIRDDVYYMHQALALGARGLGNTAPNPSVGCVIVAQGSIIGEGWTQPGGRPHAETEALKIAGERERGATAYVTLEPCSHQGVTPPCTDALIKAGIARVVIACVDPHPHVNGQGIEKLRQAGITVDIGVLEAEAKRTHRGFFKRVLHSLPEVTVKIATSQDGQFSITGKRWITGDAARQYVHRMRAEHDAILTGIGTVLADDPLLTCRLEGLEHASPKPYILDSHLRMPENAKLVRAGTVIFTLERTLQLQADKIRYLKNQSVEVIAIEEQNGGLSLKAALQVIAAEGANRLMIETGPILSQAFLSSGFVDSLYWFTAPITAGKPQPITHTLTLSETVEIGEDRLNIFQSTTNNQPLATNH